MSEESPPTTQPAEVELSCQDDHASEGITLLEPKKPPFDGVSCREVICVTSVCGFEVLTDCTKDF